MNKLTQLTNECLANMPMLADAICHTTIAIGEIFGSYYNKVQDRVQQFLNDKPELKYEIDERNSEQLSITFFPYIKVKGRKQMPQLHNVVNIYSVLIFYNQFRRKTVNAFYVEFGYAMSGNKENIIYLNLTVGEMNPDISVFNKITTNIEKELIEKWDIQIEDKFIELHIVPDQNLTEETIENCFNDFMAHILNPLLTDLN
ncbi:hypothetical protein [uncultured Alistipes sp.]|uniref:hypothetical protein n=1 Tax=uncultured Alistipes sp. TaxID=538949 RepID=UPI002595F309|nr:hypothetical protein [uncultured Alistipes sp.]